MNKKFASISKLISVSISAFILLCGSVPCFNALLENSSSVDSPAADSKSTGINNGSAQTESRKFFVANFRELLFRAGSAEINDEIVLTDDISLDIAIVFKSSCRLNLNGHTISVKDNDQKIVVGQKEFSHTEKTTIKHPGHYTWEKNRVKIVTHPSRLTREASGNLVYTPVPPTEELSWEKVWHPETYEVVYKDIYKYDGSVDVIIQNGSIKKLRGQDGYNGKKDANLGYNGTNGITPEAPIYIISGILRLYNVNVQGGDGGDGGNGGYQSLWHIVFGGGSAGNGGNGGNAGNAVSLERKEAKILKDDLSNLYVGKPGKGGIAGKPNPNYWVYRGWNGSDGENGKNTSAIVVK